MFYNQPLSVRFGTELLRQFEKTSSIDPYWDSLDIAVAWVRGSGMAHLSNGMEQFLRRGGSLSFVVGIDLKNTTKEGLSALLELESHGNCETYVYHNEAGSIFHPKLFLFRNDEEARLIVGSNNITESGLFSNVEAGLQVDTNVDENVVLQALDALSSWKDTTTKLALRLDDSLLEALSDGGYVLDEAASRSSLRRERERRAEGKATAPLFGARHFSPPKIAKLAKGSPPASTVVSKAPAVPTAPIAIESEGSVMLMRLRKASLTDRPTQTQIPFRAFNTFFDGVTVVRSAHSWLNHKISRASARGGQNTLKLEIPEMRDFIDPVARFERHNDEIVYEAYDASTPKGRLIMKSLEEGMSDGTTQQSIRDLSRATLWREI